MGWCLEGFEVNKTRTIHHSRTFFLPAMPSPHTEKEMTVEMHQELLTPGKGAGIRREAGRPPLDCSSSWYWFHYNKSFPRKDR